MSDDEKLTTEQVRRDWIAHINEYVGTPEDELEQEFDTWLDSIKEESYYNGYDNGSYE